MRKFALAAVAAAALATPALAQESAPFTGLRVEGLLGWDRLQNGGHDDALMYGVGVGYDRQIGGFLGGVEAEIADSDARACAGLGSALSPRTCARAARDIYVGARLGTVVGPALLYAKAGYTNARAKLTQDTTGGRVTLGKTDLDGFRVGGGAEYALSQNTFLKAEYRYSNYQDGLERHQVVGGFGVRF